MEITPEGLAAKFEAIFPHLDERQRRALMGAEAREIRRPLPQPATPSSPATTS